jgi:hypothetical protein
MLDTKAPAYNHLVSPLVDHGIAAAISRMLPCSDLRTRQDPRRDDGGARGGRRGGRVRWLRRPRRRPAKTGMSVTILQRRPALAPEGVASCCSPMVGRSRRAGCHRSRAPGGSADLDSAAATVRQRARPACARDGQLPRASPSTLVPRCHRAIELDLRAGRSLAGTATLRTSCTVDGLRAGGRSRLRRSQCPRIGSPADGAGDVRRRSRRHALGDP